MQGLTARFCIMFKRALAVFGAMSLCALSAANVDMDHVSGDLAGITSNSVFATAQVFEPARSGYNSFVIDDFSQSLSVVSHVAFVFETSGFISDIRGWTISLFASKAVAGASGASLQNGALASIVATASN